MILCLFLAHLLFQTTDTYVLLLSFDGFRHDYFNIAHTPNLDKLIERGTKAKSLIPVFPTMTYPNHYSIVTGLYSESHGIVGNRFYDRNYKKGFRMLARRDIKNPKWFKGETIWITAKKNGIKTASLFWPGTEVKGRTPDYYRSYNEEMNNSARVSILMKWLKLPIEKRPRLILGYFTTVDDAGHRYGARSMELVKAIENLDIQLGKLLSQIKQLPIADQIQLIIVSDHGMTNLSNSKRISYSKMKQIASSQGVKVGSESGTMVKMYSTDSLKLKRAYTLLKKEQQPYHVFNKQEISEKLHFRFPARSPDLAVVASNGFYISDTEISKIGTHGYLATEPEMHGIFIGAGQKFKQNIEIDSFENIHIYPILIKLLGIDYSHKIDGNQKIAEKVLR